MSTDEEEEFKMTYIKRYRYIPFTSRKEYSPIPLRIQIPPICPEVYTTEHIFVPEHWDPPKITRFIGYIYKTFKPQSRI